MELASISSANTSYASATATAAVSTADLQDQASSISLPSLQSRNSKDIQSNHSSSSSNLRRSIRPKPPPESLISSPPAIKFYESTVIRKSLAPSSRSIKVNRSKSKHSSPISSSVATTTDSISPLVLPSKKVLKLRMPQSHLQSLPLIQSQAYSDADTSNFSKENNPSSDSKRNLRVVKLMMPDATEEDDHHHYQEDDIHFDKIPLSSPNSDSKSKSKSPVKILPTLAPKPSSNDTFIFNESKRIKKSLDSSKDIARSKSKDGGTAHSKQRNSARSDSKRSKTSEIASSTPFIDLKSTSSQSQIVNEDICSSCGGLGNFICCDACPRSFHFTCAEPPLDPQNLPESDWFCSQCQSRNEPSNNPINTDTGSLWDLMKRDVIKMNPKCFVMPRRFRYQPKDEDLVKIQSKTLINSSTTSNPTTTPNTCNASSTLCTGEVEPIVINQSIYLDHCGIKAPNIHLHKSLSGYCHYCNLFGLTREALNSNSDSQDQSSSSTSPSSVHSRPMMSCSICPLYWHLDCLTPPLATFPSKSESSSWTCPIHFTTEKCLALDLVEALVQATMLLPESAVRLQFERKVERFSGNTINNDDTDDEFERDYGISDAINVPLYIKSIYQQYQ